MIEANIIIIGLCHTDIHMRHNEWGTSNYPLLAGHEAVATVSRIGDAVRNLNVGDRVAIAWIRDSCGACDGCLVGRENICEPGYQGTYLGASSGPWGASKLKYNEHGGCFVRVQRIEARFAIKIPEGLPSEIACPLLCGGATMYEPLCDYTSPNTRVGIASIGGLGTAGIKLARLRGCVVYALSSSAHKKEGALAAGAHEFVDTTDEKDMAAHAASLDVVIDTAPVNVDVSKYLSLLKNGGTYVRAGIPDANDQTFKYEFIPLIFQQKKIAGTTVSGTKRTKEMLDLVSRNLDFMQDVDVWKTEHVPISQINDAMDKLENRANKGYRYVLEW